MTEYSGSITMLGNNRIDSEGTRFYSVITIGGRDIRQIAVSEYLDNYLQQCLHTGEKTTLVVSAMGMRNQLATIQQGGRLLMDDPQGSAGTFVLAAIGMMALAASLIFFPALLLAGWFFWGAYTRLRFNRLVRSAQ